MIYQVRFTREAQQDLERLFDNLFDFVIERELARDGGDLDLAELAIAAIQAAMAVLERFPFSCRKASDNPFVRELIIPFGNTGYVALFEIVDAKNVVVGAVRHQREDDYH